MAKTTPRLHLDAALSTNAEIALEREQGHYLVNVLRHTGGDPVRVFNNNDGEWLAYITDASKKSVAIRCEQKSQKLCHRQILIMCLHPSNISGWII